VISGPHLSKERYWRGYVTVAGVRREVSLGTIDTATKREATAELHRLAQAMIVEGPTAGPITLGRFLASLDDALAAKKRITAADYRRAFELLIEAWGDDRRLESITPADAQAWINNLGLRLGRFSVHKLTTRAKWAFDRATKMPSRAAPLIKHSPFADVEVPAAVHDGDFTYVTGEQIGSALAHCDWPTGLMILVARLAGLRANEITLVGTDDIVLASRSLRVRLPEDDVENTKRRFRPVPCCPALWLAVERRVAQLGPGRPLIGWGQDAASRKVVAALKKAGIETAKPLHDLRKSLETDWLRQHPMALVCQWLGNSPTVAMRHYFKHAESDLGLVTGLGDPLKSLRDDMERLTSAVADWSVLRES
jgi:integrase